ncbi:helix-hairpin-helix domain-containing protein [Ornithinibacillus bavariensis]|uniref:helix-hairpin-helix domain-containing protein n=1 Tax=Ornithinibacillus bavariensis TaxID=545502 RepID=UPI000EE4DB99|nr:competence protein ComEA [Ornithinibacillus sp.]
MIHLLRKNLFAIGIGITALIVLFFMINREKPSTTITPLEQETSLPNETNLESNESQLMVDIKGEVMSPGVYDMPSDARVKDVVDAAGGFTKDADQQMINLAQKVLDEMIIIVPKHGEMESDGTSEQSKQGKVRINYASEEEIQQLPGIGPSKARAIIQYREEFGYFKQVEDLLEVSGIGEKTLDALKEEIQIP